MLQPYSVCNVADNSGAKQVRVIQKIGSNSKKGARIGDIVVGSVIEAAANGQVKKKEVIKAVIVRTKSPIHRADGSSIKFDDNAVVIINPDKTPRATRVIGPVGRELRDFGYAKIISLAQEVM